jgi:putative Mg2+ transporter-C (MgtC) family protein
MEDWQTQLLTLAAAAVLALPAAVNRELHSQIMGLRTFPLVSVGACAYMLIGLAFISPDHSESLTRVMQGVLGGIGFIGGGAILKNEDRVRGTATAGCIWVLGALGVACAMQEWVIAVALSLMSWMALTALFSAKQELDGDNLSESDGD